MSGALVSTFGTLVLLAAAQGLALDCLVLVASRACIHEFNRMVAKKETVLNWLSPQGSAQREQKIPEDYLPVLP